MKPFLFAHLLCGLWLNGISQLLSSLLEDGSKPGVKNHMEHCETRQHFSPNLRDVITTSVNIGLTRMDLIAPTKSCGM